MVAGDEVDAVARLKLGERGNLRRERSDAAVDEIAGDDDRVGLGAFGSLDHVLEKVATDGGSDVHVGELDQREPRESGRSCASLTFTSGTSTSPSAERTETAPSAATVRPAASATPRAITVRRSGSSGGALPASQLKPLQRATRQVGREEASARREGQAEPAVQCCCDRFEHRGARGSAMRRPPRGSQRDQH